MLCGTAKEVSLFSHREKVGKEVFLVVSHGKNIVSRFSEGRNGTPAKMKRDTFGEGSGGDWQT